MKQVESLSFDASLPWGFLWNRRRLECIYSFDGTSGAGKASSRKLIAEYKIPHISTMRYVRAAAKQGTELGKEAKDTWTPVASCPTSLPSVLFGRLSQTWMCQWIYLGWISEPKSRLLPSTAFLTDLGIKLTGVVNIVVPDAELVGRGHRQTYLKACGATYHVNTIPVRWKVCAINTAVRLYQRDDDKEEL